ncbi:MAG: sensor histidine kinase [Gammaproteobacteria bacterium]|jgi:PAS domain S-box-containing protein|nr:sensor histidine kinase [Gammaproteobacteria bacterium]
MIKSYLKEINSPILGDNIESLLAILPGNVYWKNKDGLYAGCNDAQAAALGLKHRDDIIGKSTLDFYPTLGGAIIFADNLVMQTATGVTLEELSEDGKIYLSKKIPLKNPAGDIVGLLGVSFDITERKQKEQDLVREKLQTQFTLDNILANLPGHVFWLDKNELILGCNNLQAQSIGYNSPKEIIGKYLYNLIPEEEFTKLHQANQEVYSSGKPLEVEEELTRADGRKGVFLSQKVPMRDKQGNIVGLLGIAFDITSKKQAEKLGKEKAVFEEKAQTMKMLAVTIAHELRTPLASISALSGAIKAFLPALIEGYELAEQNDLPVSPVTAQQINALKALPDDFKQVINSANTFIDMLLAKVNLEKNKPINMTKLLMSESVDKALQQYPFNIGGKELVHWDKSNDFTYRGDELLTIYVLFNLLKNGIYYIAAARKGQINIWLEPGEDYNKLHFMDTGQGISPDILPHMFEQFYSKTRHGTGVGLAFCKMVMDSFGGKISCESVEGEFSHFILAFPVNEAMEVNRNANG